MDPWQELQERIGRIADLTDEELAQLEADLQAFFDDVRAGEIDIEGDALEVLGAVADGVEATRVEAQTRMAAAEEQQAAIDALADRVHGAAETEPDSGEGDQPDDGADAGNASDNPDVTTEPATEPATEPVQDAQPEPVAAAVTPPRRPLSPISRIAARRPATQAPRPGPAAGRSVITAAAELPGFAAGQQINGMEELAEALIRRADPLRSMSLAAGAEMRHHVATIRADYPEDQRLGRDAVRNEQVITAALGQSNALVAAGGICAPATPLYDQISIAEDARPARMALPSFGAERGGVIVTPSPVWTDYASGVRVWTTTNDEEALVNANVRKPCVRVDCDTPTTEEVYAIPVCVTVGNFYAMTWDERVQAILNGVGAWQARVAERELLDRIGGDSTNVTAGQTLGTARDVLAHLDLAIEGFRNRQRVGDNFRLELWLPRWLRGNMRADLVRSGAVTGTIDEMLAVADATIQAFFDRRNVNVTWLWEGENSSGQDFGAQGAGALDNWPDHVVGYLFNPGAWLFLDAGRIDISIGRDSTLNTTNDLQIWSETLEGLAYRGIESIRLDMDICPSGEAAALTDVTGAICTTGS